MENETIGVILPVFNGAEYIAQAIDSVLNQNSPPDEFVIFDNGSTDGTTEILTAYQLHTGIRVVTAANHHPRMVDSWNSAVREIQTNWFHLMSADDELRKNFVKSFRQNLEGPQAAISMLSEEINSEGQVTLAKFSIGNRDLIQGKRLVEANLFSSTINVASVLVRKRAWEEVGGYPSEYSFWHDMVFWQRLAGAGGVLKVNEVVARYRVDSTRVKSEGRLRGVAQDREIYLSSEIPKLRTQWGIDVDFSKGRVFSWRPTLKRVAVICLSEIKKLLYGLGIMKW